MARGIQNASGYHTLHRAKDSVRVLGDKGPRANFFPIRSIARIDRMNRKVDGVSRNSTPTGYNGSNLCCADVRDARRFSLIRKNEGGVGRNKEHP